jgi:hypothetical protein
MPANGVNVAHITVKVRVVVWKLPSTIMLHILSWLLQNPLIPDRLVVWLSGFIFIPLWTKAGAGKWKFTMFRVPVNLSLDAAAAAEPSQEHDTRSAESN